MWNVPVQYLCDNHLLGEHGELHMFVGSLEKGKSIQGHIDKGQIETACIGDRHGELAAEMRRRGFKHESPLPQPDVKPAGQINVPANLADLRSRCHNCRARIDRKNGSP